MDEYLCRRSGRFGRYARKDASLLFLALFVVSCSVFAFVPIFAFASSSTLLVAESEFAFPENVIEVGNVKNTKSSQEKADICDESDAKAKDIALDESLQFQQALEVMLEGRPMVSMASEIAKRDRETAAFLLGIALKESAWGRHAPLKNDKDCFNYWGYKSSGSRGTSLGYACFENEEEAVRIVGNRIATLIHEKNLNTPERMIVWKCGSSCARHSSEDVSKWISDVRSVYQKVLLLDKHSLFAELPYFTKNIVL